jgi:putative Holliday junction resolvase
MTLVAMPETVSPEGTWLGFDFGMRRIGVAVGQTATRTAGALVTVSHAEQPDWQAITKLVQEWKPSGLVVGLPLDSDGNETDMSRAARRFASDLGQRFNVPVFFIDERLTSIMAGTQFAEARSEGRARRKDARKLDAMAAKIILENWLQSLPPAGTNPPGAHGE